MKQSFWPVNQHFCIEKHSNHFNVSILGYFVRFRATYVPTFGFHQEHLLSTLQYPTKEKKDKSSRNRPGVRFNYFSRVSLLHSSAVEPRGATWSHCRYRNPPTCAPRELEFQRPPGGTADSPRVPYTIRASLQSLYTISDTWNSCQPKLTAPAPTAAHRGLPYRKPPAYTA